jgi:hypothetical protein
MVIMGADAGRLRGVVATLLDLARVETCRVRIVTDAELPQVVMHGGEPFVLHCCAPLSYRQVRPFRADGGLVIENGGAA